MLYKSIAPASITWMLEADFYEDFQEFSYQNLKRLGLKNVDKDRAVHQYFNYLLREIKPKPRRILYSSEFQCPAGYEMALQEFEDKVVQGKPLWPFMSDKVLRADYDDLLLNDWNIHHFHLSRRYRDDGFVGRSNYNIFARVMDDTVYALQIYDHNAEHLYCKQEMVRIMRDNWPELLEDNRIQGFARLQEEIDDEKYEMLRQAHISSFVDLGEGEMYGLIGGGYASNGYSTLALRNADYWGRRIEQIEKRMADNMSVLKPVVEDICGRSIPVMKLRLMWIEGTVGKDETYTMAELDSGLIVQMNVSSWYLRICHAYEVFG